jgi:hypothetical protein
MGGVGGLLIRVILTLQNLGLGHFSLLHNVQIGSGTHLPSFRICTLGYFPGDNAAGCEVHQSPPSSAEVTNVAAIAPLPNTSSWLVLK